MLDSGVPDIALEPDKTVQKVHVYFVHPCISIHSSIFQVEDKFRLDLTDEEAVKYLQGLIDISIRAIFPELMEKIHRLAQVNHIKPLNHSTNYTSIIIKY